MNTFIARIFNFFRLRLNNEGVNALCNFLRNPTKYSFDYISFKILLRNDIVSAKPQPKYDFKFHQKHFAPDTLTRGTKCSSSD